MKKRVAFFAVFLCAAILTGCVDTQPLIKQTVSGYPEGLFKNSRSATVGATIMDACAQQGMIIFETAPNQIVCGKILSGNQAVLAQMLVGNSYSTQPVRKIRFTLYPLGEDVKVTAQQWIESQMPGGQVRTQQLTANKHKNYIQQFLFDLGAE